MPSLTTQSIGVAVAPLATTTHQAIQQSRASQAGVQAGVQQAENAVRAINSATQAQRGAQRTVQAEPRAEGVFEEQSDPEESTPRSMKSGQPSKGKIDRIA